jgi:cytidylate kinase
MTTITISRQFGSGGDEIVEKVCQALGYHQFSKTDIARAAFEAGLSVLEAIDYSEDNFKVKNFFDRLFKRPTTVAQLHVWKEDAMGMRSVERIDVDEEGALALVQKAVKAAYQANNMVIVGRGGQIILKGLANTLHVRIEANIEDRIHTIKNQLKQQRGGIYGTSENVELRREVQDMIANHDKASAGYIKQFYGYDWADPALYDLIINTSQVNIETAVNQIVEKVHTPQPAH